MKRIIVIASIAFTSCTSADKKPATAVDTEFKSSWTPEKKETSNYNSLMISLESALQTFKNPISVDSFLDASSDINSLAYHWKLCKEADETKADSVKIFSDKLKPLLIAYQKKMFPKYRKVFADHSNKILWKDDAGARLVDENSMVFWGNQFLRNADKQSAADAIGETATKFRFKRIGFSWIDSGNDITWYSYDTPKDTDPVILNN